MENHTRRTLDCQFTINSEILQIKKITLLSEQLLKQLKWNPNYWRQRSRKDYVVLINGRIKNDKKENQK